MSIQRSWLTSCMMMFMGNRTLKKSGVTGCIVPGCSTGCGGTGMSALMLYQAFGNWLSSSRNLSWSLMTFLLRGTLHGDDGDGDASDPGTGVFERATFSFAGFATSAPARAA